MRVSRDLEEYGPMVPTEVVTATSTEYSALGAKSWSITLVVEVLTVVCSPLPVFNPYLTFWPEMTPSHTLGSGAIQVTLAELHDLASTITSVGGPVPSKIQKGHFE